MQGMRLHPCSCMPLPVRAVQMRLPQRLAPSDCPTRPLRQRQTHLRLTQEQRAADESQDNLLMAAGQCPLKALCHGHIKKFTRQKQAGQPLPYCTVRAPSRRLPGRTARLAGIASKVMVCMTLPSSMHRRAGLTAVQQAELEYAQQPLDQACWGSALGQGQLGC